MIYIAIGSNLKSRFGNKFINIKKTISLLRKKKIVFLKISNFYKTPSYPNKKFPNFINIVAKIKFSGTALDLLDAALKVEKFMGRIRSLKNSPRTCDIDIIDFKSKKVNTKKLILPHPRLTQRNFVLFPLNEINPNWTHPINNQKIDFLIKKMNLKLRNEITKKI